MNKDGPGVTDVHHLAGGDEYTPDGREVKYNSGMKVSSDWSAVTCPETLAAGCIKHPRPVQWPEKKPAAPVTVALTPYMEAYRALAYVQAAVHVALSAHKNGYSPVVVTEWLTCAEVDLEKLERVLDKLVSSTSN